jgi:hypothetical protein
MKRIYPDWCPPDIPVYALEEGERSDWAKAVDRRHKYLFFYRIKDWCMIKYLRLKRNLWKFINIY